MDQYQTNIIDCKDQFQTNAKPKGHAEPFNFIFPTAFFCLEGSNFEGFGMSCAWKNAISKACWIWAATLERKPWPPKVVPEGLVAPVDIDAL